MHSLRKRISNHPIVSYAPKPEITFTFDGKTLSGLQGEMISSALFANGIHAFGEHYLDDSEQGIFCANGQCAQCLVLVNGMPRKACVTPLTPDMEIKSVHGLPALPSDDLPFQASKVSEIETEVLIIGAGPAGLSAALELGRYNIPTLVIDDKHQSGGKLTLQTHNFFGSMSECYAGTRGVEIGTVLAEQVSAMESVSVWTDSPAVGVFYDGKVGVVKQGAYCLINPNHLVIATGAREKALAFPGCDLPGVFGAGAFQTLVNRDGIECSQRVMIVGGGNVGLIVAYHALQAGISVAAVVEAMPRCGGYKVHLDKIKRLGVPIYTSHTILQANGNKHVEQAVIGKLDEQFQLIPGTEKQFNVDTVLIAIGLSPVNELAIKAQEYNIPTYVAGDANEIAEASAAIFSGRITGREVLKNLEEQITIPASWKQLAETLKSKPGTIRAWKAPAIKEKAVFPVIRCTQNIPCDPCVHVCPKGLIRLDGTDITGPPVFEGQCTGCAKCVSICPGLAITLVDTRKSDPKKAIVVVPWEMPDNLIRINQEVVTSGCEGETIGKAIVIKIRTSPLKNKRSLVYLEVPHQEAVKVAGIKLFDPPSTQAAESLDERDTIVCRCERVTKQAIVEYIQKTGCRDINALKAGLGIGLGACGGKTCTELILRIFRELGINPSKVAKPTIRPVMQEVPIVSIVGGQEVEE